MTLKGGIVAKKGLSSKVQRKLRDRQKKADHAAKQAAMRERHKKPEGNSHAQ